MTLVICVCGTGDTCPAHPPCLICKWYKPYHPWYFSHIKLCNIWKPDWWNREWRNNGGLFLADRNTRLKLNLWRSSNGEYTELIDMTDDKLVELFGQLELQVLKLETQQLNKQKKSKRIDFASSWLAKINQEILRRKH